ncbi:hypothetical protein TYRP_019520 [Tyrophagus putrescentiae]|nr:hypothetical protein TYRP_019520 [Tyrophagus putrescentiae]
MFCNQNEIKVDPKQVMVAIAITFSSSSSSSVQAAEPGVIVGLNIDAVTLFTAQDSTFSVVNVGRATRDQAKHVTLGFTLKGAKVLAAKSVTHQARRSTWGLQLNDETVLDVRVQNLTTAHEMTVTWPGNAESQDEEREICFNLGKDVKWYVDRSIPFNTYQQYHQQWPMDLGRRLEKVPFNSLQKEPNSELQHIVEGTFLASNGFILRLNGNSPLWYRTIPAATGSGSSQQQEPQMCISTAAAAPYNAGNTGNGYLDISFTLYSGADLRQTYITMSNHLLGGVGGIPRPMAVPEEHMFAYPIWTIVPGRSQEFAEAADLNSAKIRSYARTLKRHKQLHSVVLLDTWWAKEKEFLVVDDTEKLRDIKQLSDVLNSADGGEATPAKLDYRLQLAVSPFVHSQSTFFKENPTFLVQDSFSNRPFVVRDGVQANHGLLDFSNAAARNWFISRLRSFQTDYHVVSFVFEPVTITDVHTKFSRFDVQDVPGLYAHEYARMAAQLADAPGGTSAPSAGVKRSLAGVKEARNNQDLSLFVYMSRREASWTDPQGIKSLIPTALALSMAGYSFIVPDLVGGSQLASSKPSPDGELYTRWAQATALMPAMQFATPPWYYANESITAAVVAAIELHTSQSTLIRSLANNRVNGDGAPIMRPMWWADPDDPKLYEAGVVDTQFLVGEQGVNQVQLLVAPILERGATQRSVYLPKGKWIQQPGGKDAPSEEVVDGGRQVVGNADLAHLLWYKRQI